MTLMIHLLQNISMEIKFIRIVHYLPGSTERHCKKDPYPRLFPQHTNYKYLNYGRDLFSWPVAFHFLLK